MANVKWLTRIEVRSERYAGRFMARDYVTIREEIIDGATVWTFATVGHDRLKSAPARVVRFPDRHQISGAAWGAAIDEVQVRVDGGAWQTASLNECGERSHGRHPGAAWVFWTLDWPDASPGEHSVTSRAIDVDGNIQPDGSNAELSVKRTYWESNGQITRRVLIT